MLNFNKALSQIILTILIFVANLFAGDHTYYVSNAGNDSTGDGTAGTPWATIINALDYADDRGAGDTITIKCVAGDTYSIANEFYLDNGGSLHNGINFVIESTISGTKFTMSFTGDYPIRIANVTSGSITISDAYILGYDDVADPRYTVEYTADKGMDITFNRCYIRPSNRSTNRSVFYCPSTRTGAQRNITCTDCKFEVYHYVINATEAGDITLTNCVFKPLGDTNGYILYVAASGAVGNVKIDGCSMYDTTKWSHGVRMVDAAASMTSFTMLNSTINTNVCVVDIKDLCKDIHIEGNTLASTTDHTIRIGQYDLADAASDRVASTGIYSTAIIDNTITCATGGLLSCTHGSRIIGNRVYGYSHVVGIYGNYSTVANNIITGALGLVEWSDFNYIANNTVYCTGNAYLSGVPHQTGDGEAVNWQYSRGSVVINNIFVTSGETSFAFWDYEGYAGYDNHARGSLTAGDSVTFPYNDKMNHYMDYNCYYNSHASGKAFRIGPKLTPTSVNTVAEIITAWQTAGKGSTTWNRLFGKINDTHSLVADPKFRDSAKIDFRLRSDSPCLNVGKPTIGAGYNTIGAWQPNPFNLVGDINDDGIVNLLDFAMLCNNWLVEME